jgi:bifunctional non-homologous end joining protein LigD
LDRHAVRVSTKTEPVARKGRREVRLSSAGRVLFKRDGVTKGDLWDYYTAVAPVLVPHLRGRPFTMKRFRAGASGPFFFQKNAPKGMPGWIPTRRFRTWPREGESRLVDFPLVDLDPPDGEFRLGVRVAHLVRGLLEELGLSSYVKTSGADGVHVLVPITRRSTFDDTRDFADGVATVLAERHPGLVTTQWRKAKRRGVFLDARQNGWGKTIASVYSVRPKPGAPVSTPLSWKELTEDVSPRDFGMAEALRRVEQHGDLFRPVLDRPQALAPARRALIRLRRGSA